MGKGYFVDTVGRNEEMIKEYISMLNINMEEETFGKGIFCRYSRTKWRNDKRIYKKLVGSRWYSRSNIIKRVHRSGYG